MGDIAKKDIQLIKQALEGITQGLLVIDSEYNLIYSNQRLLEIFDFPSELVKRGTPLDQLHQNLVSRGEYNPGDVGGHFLFHQKHIIERSTYRLDRKRKDGTFLAIAGNPLPNGGYVLTFTDITYEKQYQQLLERDVATRTDMLNRANRHLRKIADVDPLLNIWNRRKFFEIVRSKWQGLKESDVVMMLDVDHFKSINDRFGHLVGDLALQAISDSLRDTLRPTDVLARFGGEEFVIFLPETGLIEAQRLAGELIQNVSSLAIAAENSTFHCTVSIGLTACQGTFAEIDSLLRTADNALYDAKRNGRNCFVVR